MRNLEVWFGNTHDRSLVQPRHASALPCDEHLRPDGDVSCRTNGNQVSESRQATYSKRCAGVAYLHRRRFFLSRGRSLRCRLRWRGWLAVTTHEQVKSSTNKFTTSKEDYNCLRACDNANIGCWFATLDVGLQPSNRCHDQKHTKRLGYVQN